MLFIVDIFIILFSKYLFLLLFSFQEENTEQTMKHVRDVFAMK